MTHGKTSVRLLRLPVQSTTTFGPLPRARQVRGKQPRETLARCCRLHEAQRLDELYLITDAITDAAATVRLGWRQR